MVVPEVFIQKCRALLKYPTGPLQETDARLDTGTLRQLQDTMEIREDYSQEAIPLQRHLGQI